MKLLLDTHTLLWFLRGDREKLSDRARVALQSASNTCFVSPVSGYELVFKAQLGRLDQIIAEELGEMIRRARLPALPITLEHAMAAGDLPGPHRDPWDRMLIATARLESMTVVTKDPVFKDYGVPTLW